ncbi:hypothetical protein BH23BAC1_BH23BAC1_31740 [soil metagenome]
MYDLHFLRIVKKKGLDYSSESFEVCNRLFFANFSSTPQ